MKNKKKIIILLVILITLNVTGVLDDLFGIRNYVLLEGAKGKKSKKKKKSQKELYEEERDKNLKDMRKMVEGIEKEKEKIRKQKEERGITQEEKDLTLEIMDFQIKAFEEMAATMLFRGEKPGQYVFATPFKAFFSSYNYAANEYQTLLGRPKKDKGRKINQSDMNQMVDIYINMVERMKKMRNIVANYEIIE